MIISIRVVIKHSYGMQHLITTSTSITTILKIDVLTTTSNIPQSDIFFGKYTDGTSGTACVVATN